MFEQCFTLKGVSAWVCLLSSTNTALRAFEIRDEDIACFHRCVLSRKACVMRYFSNSSTFAWSAPRPSPAPPPPTANPAPPAPPPPPGLPPLAPPPPPPPPPPPYPVDAAADPAGFPCRDAPIKVAARSVRTAASSPASENGRSAASSTGKCVPSLDDDDDDDDDDEDEDEDEDEEVGRSLEIGSSRPRSPHSSMIIRTLSIAATSKGRSTHALPGGNGTVDPPQPFRCRGN